MIALLEKSLKRVEADLNVRLKKISDNTINNFNK
jgi:hypothetical protein